MQDTKAVTCQIVLVDGFDDAAKPTVTVEMRSSDPTQKDSMSNVFTAWLATNWDELFLMFKMQLKAHEQERTGAQDVVANNAGPRLVDSSGKRFISGEEQIESTQQILFQDGTPLRPITGTVYDTSEPITVPAALDVISPAPAPAYEPPVLSPGISYDAPAPSPSPCYSSPSASAWSDSSPSSDSSSSCSDSSSSSSSDW